MDWGRFEAAGNAAYHCRLDWAGVRRFADPYGVGTGKETTDAFYGVEAAIRAIGLAMIRVAQTRGYPRVIHAAPGGRFVNGRDNRGFLVVETARHTFSFIQAHPGTPAIYVGNCLPDTEAVDCKIDGDTSIADMLRNAGFDPAAFHGLVVRDAKYDAGKAIVYIVGDCEWYGNARTGRRVCRK